MTIANPYLTGASTQSRCAICEHPILLEGRCLDCGAAAQAATEAADLAGQRAAPSAIAPTPSSIAEMQAMPAEASLAGAFPRNAEVQPHASTIARNDQAGATIVGPETRFLDVAAAGVVLWAADGTILVGWDPIKQKWSLPGGKREHGESVRACATRELYEETQLRAHDLQIDWSNPEYILPAKYVYFQGHLGSNQPSATSTFAEYRHVHLHETPSNYAFCLERAISSLQAKHRPRPAGLLEGFEEPRGRDRDAKCSEPPAEAPLLRTQRLPPAYTDSAAAESEAVGDKEPTAKRRRVDSRYGGGTRAQHAPQEARKRAAARRKRAAPGPPGLPESGTVFTLSEQCNEAALEDLASRRRAATWQPRNRKGVPYGPTLRKIISDFLQQVREGSLTTVFREEEHMVALGLRGRRYSGYKRTTDADPEVASFENLITSGVNPGSVARSFFGLPNWLRDIARVGLPNCYVLDMVNAHPNIQHRRHPQLTALREYVENREEVLSSVPAVREKAKELFIRLVYGGHWRTWCKDNGVDPRALPDIVEQFRLAQQQMSILDAEENPEILQRLGAEDPGRATELLQYALNTAEERRAMDNIEEEVHRLGGKVMAYEHDGLFVYAPCRKEELLRRAQAAAGYPLTAKACAECSTEEAWKKILDKSGGAEEWEREGEPGAEACASQNIEPWDARDSDWRETEALAREAAVAPPTAHDTFAQLLVTEPLVSDAVPWPLKDLFKLPQLASNYVWYDAQGCVWVEGGPNGANRLKAYVTQMLQRRLCQYEFIDHRDGRDVRVHKRSEFGSRAFKEGVESCLKEMLLVDPYFHLDPAESLRYLSFEGGTAWDRDTETWVRTRPDMLISRTTNWRFQECTNPAMEKVDRALAMVRASQDERGLHLPSLVPDDAAQLLDEARNEFPELQFWFDFTREWEGALYELTHAARGLFGILMAEALYVRGSGRNGKDTVCNAFKAVGGSYVQSIACSALCQISDPNSASPVILSCRGRRVVCVREVPKDCKILEGVYKCFTDPVSEMQGRNLYERLETFSPQYLPFFASNGPIPIAMDCGVRERTAIVDHVSIFRDNPTECNDLQWKDMNKRRLETYRPGFFWIFRRVYHHLLKGRSTRNVCPVPAGSLQQKALDCADANSEQFDRFLASIEKTRTPKDASTKEEVDAHAAKLCGLALSEASIFLNGKGFLKIRRDRGLQRNLYFYQYAFMVDGQKEKPQFLKISEGKA